MSINKGKSTFRVTLFSLEKQWDAHYAGTGTNERRTPSQSLTTRHDLDIKLASLHTLLSMGILNTDEAFIDDTGLLSGGHDHTSANIVRNNFVHIRVF